MSAITNAAAYHFAKLSDLPAMRADLLDHCKQAQLRGTILLATEGINLFVAGTDDRVQELLEKLRRKPGLEQLTAKFSLSETQPFRRMLVKIKREIIAFGQDNIDPVERPAPRVTPRQLKQWLDEGRDVVLLDTRNDYEVKLGTFRNAVALDLGHFRQFPEAVDKLDPSTKEQTIVSFCTGGIRCEKAAPYLIEKGYRDVYQLDGGILKYFEECGASHYDGECFVFDQRVGLDPGLAPVECESCSVCNAPLLDSELQATAGETICLTCAGKRAASSEARLAERASSLQQVTNPLPGSVAADNFRPIKIEQEFDRMELSAALVAMFPHLPQTHWSEAFASGRILRSDRVVAQPSTIVRAGARFVHWQKDVVEPAVSAAIRFIYEDDFLIVVNKPAPLPMHPSGRFVRNTLTHFIELVYAPLRPRICHRLDANTSGLVVLAKTKQAAASVGNQFESNKISKSYLAMVHGVPAQREFTCKLPLSDKAGVAGSRTVVDEQRGVRAHTEFKLLATHGEQTLLLCRPITGRTNQIRVHLWALGLPIVGDPTYLADQKIADQQTRDVDAAPMQLHAWRITLSHPATKQPIEFVTPLPAWCSGYTFVDSAQSDSDAQN